MDGAVDMESSLATDSRASRETFAERVGVELRRAERYRVFLSLTVLDFGPARDQSGAEAKEVMEDLAEQIQEVVRACDYVELLGESCLAVLLPETKRQEAEIVAHRLADLVTGRFSKSSRVSIKETVPVEIASYPDTAGAKTLSEFLAELVAKGQN